ncbi:hypothetical protein SUGI_0977360 [Cryptomeria japonica]|nr:hypothetical protein SUGI_0977360 [Cryptomeria japonica]
MKEITTLRLISLVRLLLGILSFIGLLSLNMWKAWKSKALWVPQGALVLSVFSIQLLGFLSIDTMNNPYCLALNEDPLERVLRNELWIDGGRVMVCVYMGCLVPQMARDSSKQRVWGDIGALALKCIQPHMLRARRD